MSNIIFDNVFTTEVSKECVNIRFGVCEPEALKKKIITDSDVKDIKEIYIRPDNFEAFFHSILSAAVKLQKDYDIDLGLNLEEN